jgi:hypothetical protein
MQHARRQRFRVTVPERLRADRQGAFSQGTGLTHVAFFLPENSQVVQNLCGLRMLSPYHLLADAQSAVEECLSLLESSLFSAEYRKAAQRVRYHGMLRAT